MKNLGIVLGVLMILGWSLPALAADRPNILFCLADDWGWPNAGAYGDQAAQTPTFDRLAREGLLFNRAFVSSPSCTPSRNAILTGQQFYRLDQGANLQSTLDPRHPNFMFLLRDAGYAIGHWRKAWGPGEFKAAGYREHPCGPEMSFPDFLKQRPRGQPFCFWFGTSDPHRPYDPGSGKAGGIELAQIHVPGFLPDNLVTRNDLADYYFEVRRFNQDVAEALKLLEQTGELDKTLIVMSGDNGAPFPHGKGNLYDWGVRVPLAIRWGSHIPSPGRQIDDFVSLTDLAPTFLQLAQVNLPPEMTGRSLLPILTRDPAVPAKANDRDFIVVGRERHAAAQEIPSLVGYPSRAIRTQRYLLILNLKPDRWPVGVPNNATHPIKHFPDCDDGPTKEYIVDHQDDPQIHVFYELCFAKRPAVELYDVQSDPDELHNLADDPAHQQIVQQLRDQLTEYLEQTADPRFTGNGDAFDQYPYRAENVLQRLRQWKAEHHRE